MRPVLVWLVVAGCDSPCERSEVDITDDFTVALSRGGSALAPRAVTGSVESYQEFPPSSRATVGLTVDLDDPALERVAFNLFVTSPRVQQAIPIDTAFRLTSGGVERGASATGTLTLDTYDVHCVSSGRDNEFGEDIRVCESDVAATIRAQFVDGADTYTLDATAVHHNTLDTSGDCGE